MTAIESGTAETPDLGTAGRLPARSEAFGELVRRLVGRPAFWITFVGILVALPILRAVLTPLPPKLPVIETLPAFELTDQHGDPRGSEDLRGKVWVAGFIFTRCTTVCPVLTTVMTDVQHRAKNLGETFRLVSITVVPEHDTPEVLQEYADAHHARTHSWAFLTGPPATVRELVAHGFKVASGGSESGNVEDVFHDTHLVLVDQSLRVRGFYDSNDPKAVDRLLRDAGLLANRGD